MTIRHVSLAVVCAIALVLASLWAGACGSGSTAGGPGATSGDDPASSGVTLRLPKEAAPAGPIADMNVATEPKPISTGSGTHSLAVDGRPADATAGAVRAASVNKRRLR